MSVLVIVFTEMELHSINCVDLPIPGFSSNCLTTFWLYRGKSSRRERGLSPFRSQYYDIPGVHLTFDLQVGVLDGVVKHNSHLSSDDGDDCLKALSHRACTVVACPNATTETLSRSMLLRSAFVVTPSRDDSCSHDRLFTCPVVPGFLFYFRSIGSALPP